MTEELVSEGRQAKREADWELPGSSTEKSPEQVRGPTAFEEDENDREDSRRYRRTVRCYQSRAGALGSKPLCLKFMSKPPVYHLDPN